MAANNNGVTPSGGGDPMVSGSLKSLLAILGIGGLAIALSYQAGTDVSSRILRRHDKDVRKFERKIRREQREEKKEKRRKEKFERWKIKYLQKENKE